MARLLEYENYKDLNGVKIPDSWELSKVKYLGNYLNGFAFKPTHWTDKGIPIIRIQNLTNQDADINRTSFIAPERYHVFKGDILISWSATLDVYIWQKEEAWLNQHIYKVKVNRNKIIEKYFYWTAKWFMGELNESSHGSTMQHLTTDKFGSFNVPLPPISEQHLITNFLDYETAQIDTLIDKQQTLIQLLKEKRQAVISHAVTKGLNPDAPMKDSGVEWLGEVPEHWVVAQLKFNTLVMQTGPFGSQLHAEEYIEEGIPLINPAHMIDGEIVPDSRVTVDEATQERLERHKLSEGDIIFARRGELGRCAIVHKHQEGWICGTGSLRATLNDKLISEYAYLLINSDGLISELSLESKGSTMDNLNTETLGRVRMPVPPRNEQNEIISHVRQVFGKYKVLIGNAERAIQLMQERRTALISAAVTGKIDVRGWVAPE
jgi:type I restriction enzyme S subunit